MLHRLRDAWSDAAAAPFGGPVGVDESCFGDKRKSVPRATRRQLTGRGTAAKTAVAGAKDRGTGQVLARVMEDASADALQGLVVEATPPDAVVCTDDAHAYRGTEREHEAVCHSIGECVRGLVHTNGIESFWSMPKRAHKGTFHKFSPRHLHRYMAPFAGRHNSRDADTIRQMESVVAGLIGKRLTYSSLIAATGLPSGARS